LNFIDRLLSDRYAELELEKYGIGTQWATVLLTPRFVTSRHVVALVFAHGAREPSLVVKVPRQPGDNDSVRREAQVMNQLRSYGAGPGIGVPEVVAVLDVGPHAVLVETAVTGAQLNPKLVGSNVAAAVSAGTAFLASLPCTRPALENGDWYQRTISGPLTDLASLLPSEPDVSELVERTHTMLEPLRSAQLPAVVEHGDMSHPNLFLDPDGRLQVVDWERSRTDGVPGHDLVFYLQYLSESSELAFSRLAQLAAFDKAFGATGWALTHLRSHLQLRGVNPDLLPLLVIAVWARSAATLAYRLEGERGADDGRSRMQAAVFGDRDFWLWRHVVDTWSRHSL
jgi:aminoglycoside phosphotransferase (APT) family kinase protein